MLEQYGCMSHVNYKHVKTKMHENLVDKSDKIFTDHSHLFSMYNLDTIFRVLCILKKKENWTGFSRVGVQEMGRERTKHKV